MEVEADKWSGTNLRNKGQPFSISTLSPASL